MNFRFLSACLLIGSLGMALGACSPAQESADLSVAAAAVSAYAASPGADKTKVAEAKRLLGVAQAALQAYQSAPAGSTVEQTALSAAVAALVAYETQLVVPPTTKA